MKNTPEQEAKMRALGIPKGSNVTFIDMGPGEGPRLTAGWTDAQIKAKTIEQIDAMIAREEKAAQGLREVINEQEDRIAGLRMVRLRRRELGS